MRNVRDLVKCSNCEWQGTVKPGANICPNCETGGTLAWQEGRPQEVEV